ncbi:MAG: hypothetical protein RMI01_08630 [Thermodesulfovibrio sp.]|nr:hypothetical protein [Thermodesulfovibrio sp.]
MKRVELYSVVYAYLYLLRSLGRPLEELLRGVVRFVEVVGKLGERERWYVELFLLIVSKEKGLDEEEVWIKLREVGGERMEFELKTYSERKYEQGLQEGLQKGIQQGLQEGLQKGIQQGLQEGLQKGLQQGLLRDAQEMVLEVVEVKLGRVPEVLKRQVKAEQDREKLRKLLRELVISSDPEKTLLNFGYSLD